METRHCLTNIQQPNRIFAVGQLGLDDFDMPHAEKQQAEQAAVQHH